MPFDFKFVNDPVSGCAGCPLSGSAKIMAEQAEGAGIMIIGEAPGATEAEQGRLFVGASGEHIRRLIGEAGITCHITNVVKCHPPNNDTPNMDLCRRCGSEYLDKEIEQLNPRAIVCLGLTATNYMFRNSIKTPNRNQIFEINGRKVIPTFHPASILHTGGIGSPQGRRRYQDIYRALLLAKSVVNGSRQVRNIVVLDTAQAVLDTVAGLNWDFGAFDVETTGLDPWGDSFQVRTMAISDGIISYSFKWFEEVRQFIGDWLKQLGCLSAYNTGFDIMSLFPYNIDLRGANLHDVMLMNYLLDVDKARYSLKALVQERLGAYEVLVKDFTRVPIHELLYYNAEDALYTAQLHKSLYAEIQQDAGLLSCYNNVLRPCIPMLASMRYDGFSLDVDRLREAAEQLRVRVDDLGKVLYRRMGCDPNKRIPVGNYLFVTSGYPVTADVNKDGTYKVDAGVLKEIIANNEKTGREDDTPRILMEYRKVHTLYSTFVEPFLGKNALHGDFLLHGTRTGRLSSANPNMQNIPRDGPIKRFFIARKPLIMLQGDLSQAELRVGASLSNDQEMIRTYCDGRDIHIRTASVVFNIPESEVSKKQRQVCKSVNFGLLYGQETRGFVEYLRTQANMSVRFEVADAWRNSFFRLYSGLQAWYDSVMEELVQNHEVRSKFGRVRRFSEVGVAQQQMQNWQTEMDGKMLLSSAFRKAVNFPVQSAASDINLQAMANLWYRLRREGWQERCRFLSTVHDSIIMEVDSSLVEWIIEFMNLSINQYEWLRVPMIMDFAVGEDWKGLAEIKQVSSSSVSTAGLNRCKLLPSNEAYYGSPKGDTVLLLK